MTRSSASFERINLFLQRQTSYAEIPLTNESVELLGKIISQILFILAVSTRAMKDSGISELTYSFSLSWLTMAQRSS
jgi:hypothetical protein